MHDAASIKQTVAEVVNRIYERDGFAEDCYFYKNRHTFIHDVEKAVINHWQSTRVKNTYRDFSVFVEQVARVFDRYAPEVYRLLLPHDMSRPQTCPLYRVAHQMISRYGRLGTFFSAEDALVATIETIMVSKLSLLQFNGHSSLKTWVMAVLNNVILQQARKEGLIGERPGSKVFSWEGQPFDEGPSSQELYADESCGQPEKAHEHSDWLHRRLKFLMELVRQGKAEQPGIPEGKCSPRLERAWILWNDYFADFFLEYTELVGSGHEFNPPPFSFPAAEIADLGKKGGHNPHYSDYLAREIGKMRGWTARGIEDDLSLPRTPKDKSRLRAAVRVRRNEGKIILVKDLQK